MECFARETNLWKPLIGHGFAQKFVGGFRGFSAPALTLGRSVQGFCKILGPRDIPCPAPPPPPGAKNFK
jgi:hypothetical protein